MTDINPKNTTSDAVTKSQTSFSHGVADENTPEIKQDAVVGTLGRSPTGETLKQDE